MGLEASTLVVSCDSAAWAQRLRFQATATARRLGQAIGEPVTGLRTVVRPPVTPPRVADPGARPGLSDSAADDLRRAAACSTHAPLREALLRLAEKARRRRV